MPFFVGKSGRPGGQSHEIGMCGVVPLREKNRRKIPAWHENCSGAEKYFTIIICIPIITW
jgi:hypothetical protein